MYKKTGGKNYFKLFILIALFNITPQVYASTITTTFAVTATVVNSCLVGAFSATTLAFGNYTGVAITNQTTTISFQCTSGDTLTFAANPGLTGTFATTRIMTNGANHLNYNIYTTAGFATVWGDGTNSTATLPATATGAVQTLTAYGNLPGAQMTAPSGA